MTRLYLVRHGETDWNREQRLQGMRDVPMNAHGAQQAHALARHFSTLAIDLVITSPLARASATAATLADACRCPVIVDARLREVDHGSFTGRLLADIAAESPSRVTSSQLEPSAFDENGGETLHDVFDRVSSALSELAADRHERSIVVVSHGVTLAVMACAAQGVGPSDYRRHMQQNAEITLLTLAPAQARSEGWR